MSVTIETRQSGNVTILDVSGRIQLGESSMALRDKLRELAAENHTRILLNLGDVSYIDSSGIGELVAGFTTLANRGGVLKLLNLTKRIKDLLQITKLYTVFEVYDDEAAAIAFLLRRGRDGPQQDSRAIHGIGLLRLPVAHAEFVGDHPRSRLQFLKQLRTKFQIGRRQQVQHDHGGLVNVRIEQIVAFEFHQ
jgi:anti-sigma B factor antagonist